MLRRYTPRNDGRVFAFTLAEVLITLVIIGVVAALTIPNLMTKYQQHVFETQFKKSLSMISQLAAKTKTDLGVSKLAEHCSILIDNTKYPNAAECINTLDENIKVLAKKKYASWMGSNPPYTTYRYDVLKTYNNKTNVSCGSPCSPIIMTNQLADGSFLGFTVNSRSLIFGVDLNGYKKPNRFGYDIFLFSLNNKNDAVSGFLNRVPDNSLTDETALESTNPLFVGTPCSLESTRESNGIGCAYYALRNKCPYDDTKTYWECLK